MERLGNGVPAALAESQNEAMVQNNEIHDNVVYGEVKRFKWRRNRDNCHSIISPRK